MLDFAAVRIRMHFVLGCRLMTITANRPFLAAHGSALPTSDVSGRSSPAFVAIRAIRDQVISPVLPRHAIDVWIAPGVVGNHRTFEIGTGPGQGITWAPHQGSQAF